MEIKIYLFIFSKCAEITIELLTVLRHFNICPDGVCLKWTLYFVSISNIIREYQFSRSFDFKKLSEMSCLHFMSCLQTFL